MNLLKNMELVFVGAMLIAATGLAVAATPAKANPARLAAVSAPAKAKIPTVYVTAKRLTAEQKAKLAS
jgi:hypothetical protein